MAEQMNEVAVKQESRVRVADFSQGIFATSDNFTLAMNMAKTLAGSTIIPDTFQGKWENCMIAIEQANRLQMSPMMVMQNMYIVYGRPSWSSKFLIAMINNSGKFDQPLKFREEEKDGKPYACTAWTTLKGDVVEGMKVTMDIAKAEGWVDKKGSKWQTMPQLMLRYRAASFFSSLNCPEVTMGLYTSDEIVDGDYMEYPIEESLNGAVKSAQIAAETKTASIPINDAVKAEDGAEKGVTEEDKSEARKAEKPVPETEEIPMPDPGF